MRLSTLLASTVLATVVATSAASAAPYVFTWNPSLTSGGTLSSPSPTSPILTAHNMHITDYATITNIGSPVVSETGILVVNSFDLNAPSVVTPGFVSGGGGGAAGAVPGASPYQLYFTFSSTSHLVSDGLGGFTGAFDSLSYTLWGDIGGTCQFGLSGISVCSAANQLVLATGSLAAGPNGVSIDSDGIPAAHADVDIHLGANAGGFFVNPATLGGFVFETSFTNTFGIVGHPNASTITIDGGGGNIDLLGVPEPVTLSVFGAGLAGAAALRRRKAKKA